MSIAKYFERRKREREREQSRRLGDVGFVIGAIVGAEKGEDEIDVLVGGVVGWFAAALFEEFCPKTASIVKSCL